MVLSPFLDLFIFVFPLLRWPRAKTTKHHDVRCNPQFYNCITRPSQNDSFQLCVTRPQTTYRDFSSGTISNRENPECMLYNRAQITQLSGSIHYTWLSSQNSVDHVHLYAFPPACVSAGQVLMFTFTALLCARGMETRAQILFSFHRFCKSHSRTPSGYSTAACKRKPKQLNAALPTSRQPTLLDPHPPNLLLVRLHIRTSGICWSGPPGHHRVTTQTGKYAHWLLLGYPTNLLGRARLC